MMEARGGGVRGARQEGRTCQVRKVVSGGLRRGQLTRVRRRGRRRHVDTYNSVGSGHRSCPGDSKYVDP